MKKIILTQLITLSLLLFSNPIFARDRIDSVKLIPTAPTTEDEIKIVYYNTFMSAPLTFISSQINIQDNQIEITLYYIRGGAQVIVHSVDTITIGHLGENDYTVKTVLNLYYTEFTDNYTTTFTVHSPSNIGEVVTENGIDIFPNPFTSEININSDLSIEKIELYSIEGKIIELGENNAVLSRRINLSGLKHGAYLMVITDGNGRKYAKKIIKRL